MASQTTPLLADDRRPNITDSHRTSDSEDGALRGQSAATHSGRSLYLRLREILLFVWALLATAGILILAVWISHNQQTSFEKPAGKRNLVFMVSDGMGPASLSLTRSFRQYIEGLDYGDTLTLDKHFWGSSRTRSSSSLVTDSAAGATAFSCAKKSYNGAIAVLPDHTPCGTVLEAAKRAGYMTGLVVTTDITDATPACFSSHVGYRLEESSIALQQIGKGALNRTVDLMFGGGRCHFLPNTDKTSCREDDVDVVQIAKEEFGWNYIDNRAAFDEFWEGKKEVPLPMMGFFADHDIPFELDRRNMNDVYPSLSEMAKTALRTLEKATEGSDKGFFLMIEGSRIDHAGHGNDPAAQVHEVLEYDKAMQAVLQFIEDSDVETVMVATSDHETGGLSVAKQLHADYPQYLWYPAVLANASSSSEYLAIKLQQHLVNESISTTDITDITSSSSESLPKLKKYINDELVVKGLGIVDATPDEITTLVLYPELAQYSFAQMISNRAQIGWSTHGHSAVDVNIYSSGGPGTDKIRGNVENTQIGEFLQSFLDVDTDEVTRILREKSDNKDKDGKSMVQMQHEMHLDAGVEEEEEEEAGKDHWAVHEAQRLELAKRI